MPKVYLIDDSAMNAFATGRDPEHASVAITRGLMEKLNREELQAVMAHEMSHVRNFDIRFAMLMAVMVGSIVMICDMVFRSVFFGRRRSSRSSDGGKGQAVMAVVALVLAILAPLLATIIQLAVSRQREYLADASAVELTRNPAGLVSAAHISDKAKISPALRSRPAGRVSPFTFLKSTARWYSSAVICPNRQHSFNTPLRSDNMPLTVATAYMSIRRVFMATVC